MGSSTRTISLKFTGDIADLVAAVGGADASLKSVNKTASDTSGFDKLNKKIGDVGKNMSYMPAIVAAAAPLAGAAILSGVGLGFIGAAALIQKGNVDVASSFGDLKNQVTSGLKDITSVAVPELTSAARSMGAEFTAVKPQLTEAFDAANPGIATLTTGVDNMITNLMPGLVRGAQASNTVLGGVSVLLGDIGIGGTNALTGLSQGAGKFASLFGQAGVTAENVGSIIGRVLPAMSSGIGSTLSVVNFLTARLADMGPVLGTVAGYVPDVVLGFKGFGLVSGFVDSAKTGIGNLASGILDLGAKVEKTSPKAANMLASLAGATGEIAGPFGAAVLVGGGLLLGLAAIMGKTTLSASQLASETASVTAAISSSGSALSAASVNALTTSDSYKTLVPLAKQAGVSQQELVLAITQGGSAFDNLQTKFRVSRTRASPTPRTAVWRRPRPTRRPKRHRTSAKAWGRPVARGPTQRRLLRTRPTRSTLSRRRHPPAYLNVSDPGCQREGLSLNTQSAILDSTRSLPTSNSLGRTGKRPRTTRFPLCTAKSTRLPVRSRALRADLYDASGGLSLTSTKGEQARTTFENIATQLATYNQALVNQGAVAVGCERPNPDDDRPDGWSVRTSVGDQQTEGRTT